jgi:predicted secreted protein
MINKTILLLACACAVSAARADTAPANVVQLSVTAAVEVPQDWLTVTLSTTREAMDAATVQAQLRDAVDAALVMARGQAQAGQLDVRSGNFRIFPRSGRDGKLVGWQGSAEVILEGRDFPRITSTAARLGTLTVAGLGFGLSREQRERAQSEAQGQAIERFKARAQDLARGFGFGGYGLREVSVNGGEQVPMPRAMMAMQAKAADAPIPVEPGRATVEITVSGSIQMR